MKQHPRGGTAAAENTRLSTSDGRSHLSSCPASGRSQETLDRAGSPAAPSAASSPRAGPGRGQGAAAAPRLGSAPARLRGRAAAQGGAAKPHPGAPPRGRRARHRPSGLAAPPARPSQSPARRPPLTAAVTAVKSRYSRYRRHGRARAVARGPALARARRGAAVALATAARVEALGGTGRDGAGGGGGQRWAFVAFLSLYSSCGETNFALKITGWGKKMERGRKK